MRLTTRMALVLVAFPYCVWASATLVRHWAGTPDGGLTWLLVAPAAGCALTLVGLGWERAQAAARHQREVPGWRRVHPVAMGLQYAGLALLSWRALWMFFSWDGMFYFPAWILLALALYRWHPRWVPAA